MINWIIKKLGLAPQVSQDEALKIGVAVQNNKLVIKIDRKVDIITFDKVQLTNFLGAVASQMGSLK